MKIDSYALDFASQHSARSELQQRESLRMWVGQRPPAGDETASASASRLSTTRIMATRVQLSLAGRAAQAADAGSAGLNGQGPAAAPRALALAPPLQSPPPAPPATSDTGEAQAIDKALDESNRDPRLLLIRQMVKMLTGTDVKVFTQDDLSSSGPAPVAATPTQATAAPQSGATQAAAGLGIEYERHEIYSEEEHTRFAANGHIRTADGQEISFQLELQMSRSYREESHVSLRAGDAQRKDPLVINFAGNAAQLTSQRFSFDLEGDGAAENIAMLAAGSGYLALDKNGNGRVDNGQELFGVASGDGFADLAHYDDDGNGWIDENDAVYEQLRVWTPSADGSGQLHTLKEKQVGALYLGSQATPFELRDSSNQSLGAVRSSGLWLSESGQVGSLQQIDLTV